MNKYQKAMYQILKNDSFKKHLSYRDLKRIYKEVTKGFSLQRLVEWKDHRKECGY